MKRVFILNADDFGLTVFHNMAIRDGYLAGILRSVSICTNTQAFNDAVENILPNCPNLSIGVHLNIMEGKALTNCPLLTDTHGNFNKSYLYLILNQQNRELQHQIQAEFKAQIEKALQHNLPLTHLDSHVHTHAIPEIFKIVCKLAKKYNIKYVRTQDEKAYLAKDTNFKKYLINLVKIALLKSYTQYNKKLVKHFGLRTNENIIGVGYTGMMDSEKILSGLKAVNNTSCVEAIIHPCKYSREISHLVEYQVSQDYCLKQEIKNLGFDISNYNEI